LHRAKGDLLILEDATGKADWLFESEIREIISKSNSQPAVVFISSCTSEFAGKIFFNAGVRHVICIREGSEIMDKASIMFSKVFYQTFFSKSYSACDSFEIAKNEIK
jgi:hypothetical protein